MVWYMTMNMDGLFINANVCLATCQANIMRFNLKKVQNSGDAKNFSMDFTYFFSVIYAIKQEKKITRVSTWVFSLVLKIVCSAVPSWPARKLFSNIVLVFKFFSFYKKLWFCCQTWLMLNGCKSRSIHSIVYAFWPQSQQ